MMSEKKQPSLLMQVALQTTAGGSAGFVEVCIMHPLDLIKTRLQIQNKINATSNAKQIYYNGVLDCFSKMYKHEGLLSYWKGILPPILIETPKRATKFVCFEQYKRFFLFGSDKPTPLTYALAGLAAGVTEGILINPFEVIKVSMQSNTSKSNEAPTTWRVTKAIVERDGVGLKGLNKGLTATVGRSGAFNMIYFGFYHSVKEHIPSYQDETKEFLRKVAIGFASGTIASVSNIPIDVAKSRIQGPQPIAGQVKYRSMIQTIVTVAREEGFGALYKGLLPKILRLGPGGAIMLLVYEHVYEQLCLNFT